MLQQIEILAVQGNEQTSISKERQINQFKTIINESKIRSPNKKINDKSSGSKVDKLCITRAKVDEKSHSKQNWGEYSQQGHIIDGYHEFWKKAKINYPWKKAENRCDE